jgi:hypothetical protein
MHYESYKKGFQINEANIFFSKLEAIQLKINFTI